MIIKISISFKKSKHTVALAWVHTGPACWQLSHENGQYSWVPGAPLPGGWQLFLGSWEGQSRQGEVKLHVRVLLIPGEGLIPPCQKCPSFQENSFGNLCCLPGACLGSQTLFGLDVVLFLSCRRCSYPPCQHRLLLDFSPSFQSSSHLTPTSTPSL